MSPVSPAITRMYVDALKRLTDAQKEKDRQLGLYNWLTAKPTEKDIEETNAKLEQATAVYDNAQRKYERVKNGPDSMTLELAQAKVADKEQQLAQAQDDLAHLTLTAPFDGVITDVKIKVGDQVTPVAVVMTLSNPNALEAQVTVVEEDYSLIQPGQSVQLYFDAQPDAQVTGHVTRIVPSRTDSTQPQYPVYIEIDQMPARVAAGMSVDASIIIAEKKNVLVLPKALVRARTDGTATVQVWANGSEEDREIKIGLIGDSERGNCLWPARRRTGGGPMTAGPQPPGVQAAGISCQHSGCRPCRHRNPRPDPHLHHGQQPGPRFAQRQFPGCPGRICRLDGSFRQRKIDPDAPAGLPGPPHQRPVHPGRHQRRPADRGAARADPQPAHRFYLPKFQPAQPHDHPGERGPAAALRRG